MLDLSLLEIGTVPSRMVVRMDLVVQRSKEAVDKVLPHQPILSGLTASLGDDLVSPGFPHMRDKTGVHLFF